MNTYKLIEYLENNKFEFIINDIYDDEIDVAEYIENDKIDELNEFVVDIEIVVDVADIDENFIDELIDDVADIDDDVEIIYYDYYNELIIKNK